MYIWAFHVNCPKMADTRKKPFNVDMAEQRIKRLFSLAEQIFPRRPELADRYVDIARRISMRHRVSIPRELKRRVCKECHAYLVPGNNSHTRLDGRNVVITCNRCGAIKRYPYK
jgi:ribonuclease P protein subunit RPR2